MSQETAKQSKKKPTKAALVRRVIIVFTLWALFGLAVRTAITTFAAAPASQTFTRTWQRTDQPVSTGQVDRTWMWGPEGFTAAMTEPYLDAPGGQRMVQYFDKSRMEDNAYRATAPWDVTNGLLVVELISGRLQVGDEDFAQHAPAQVNVAGDQGVPGVTYAELASLLSAPAAPDGATLTARLDANGTVSDAPSLAGYGVTAAYRVTVPGIDHQVASPFWAFMNASGLVYEAGGYGTAALFESPFYATGYPLTEAYWSTVTVGGVAQDVLLQCFERRCLTYTPGNPEGWQVEAGNVGQHYYQWRYEQIDDDPTPPEEPTPTPPEETPPPDPALNYSPLDTFGELWDPDTTLGYAQGLAVGGGYVYIAEQSTDRVSIFTVDGHYVGAWTGFDSPGDVAIDRDGNVWVSDTNNYVVKKFSSDGTLLTQIGTGTAGCGPGELAGPDGIAFMNNGHILVADFANNRVARFNAAGAYQGAIGDAACGSGLGNYQFWYPHDVAVDASGNFYVVDSLNDRIVKYNAAGTYINEWGVGGGLSGNGPGEFDRPFGIAISPNGYAYVADTLNDRVQVLNLDGTPLMPHREFGGPGTDPGLFGEILDIEIDGDGNVYVADEVSDRILKFDMAGNYLLEFGEFNTGPAYVDEPSSMVASPDGYLYVLDSATDRVVKFTQDGQYIDEWGQTGNGSGEFIVPLGIEIDGDGNIYVADTINNRVQRFTPNGLSMPGWEDSYMILTYPNDLAIYGDRAYVLEGDSHRVRSFTLDGAPIGQWGSFGTTEGGHLNAPYGIATDSYGYVYVADTLNNRIQKFTPDGGYLAQFGNDGGPAQLSAPRRLEVADNGNVYVLDSGNYRVVVFQPQPTS